MYEPWTSRDVHFQVFPREPCEHVEKMLDALCEHYWERPGWIKRWVEPGFGSSGRTVHATGFPWWMPKWWALRTVTKIAHREGVAGGATFQVERNVL